MMKFLLIFVLFAGVVFAADEPARIDSTDLPHTTFTEYLAAPLYPGTNLLYCASFQLAWDALEDHVVHEPIRLAGDPPAVGDLNLRRIGQGGIGADSVVALADRLTPEFLARINRILHEKFGSNAPETVREVITPDTFFAYAYLYKTLRFRHPFESMDKPLHFPGAGGGRDLQAFGVETFNPGRPAHREMADQVTVWNYRDDRHFTVRLTGDSTGDEIILARVSPSKTLLDTIRGVLGNMTGATPDPLRRGDSLQVPILDFDIRHDFTDLTGRRLLNQGWDKWVISKAQQWIRFRFDRKGAVLKSEARIAMRLTAMRPGPSPRHLVFDGPFLLMMKQTGAPLPYLAVWIGDAEIFPPVKSVQAAGTDN